jgi:hypothetical protein
MIKTIYILWFQGFDNAPEIIKQCVNSWKYYNPDWNIILLDNNNLRNYINLNNHINNINKKNINKTALSDIVRVLLLKKYGGLWVDATTFCNKPLDDWLPNYINEGFFAFNKPGPDRLLASWFIYSENNSYIINKWYMRTLQYYKNHNSPHTYFWFHYLFGNLYNSDKIFKEIWDKVPKLSAVGRPYLQPKVMMNNVTNEIKLDINSKNTPLFKLTYKCEFPKYNENIILYYLYSTINSTTSL